MATSYVYYFIVLIHSNRGGGELYDIIDPCRIASGPLRIAIRMHSHASVCIHTHPFAFVMIRGILARVTSGMFSKPDCIDNRQRASTCIRMPLL